MRAWIAVLALLLLLLQYGLWFGDPNLPDLWERRGDAQALAKKVERLEARNRRLRAEVEDLRKGGEAIVERAREDLGMVGEGEIFIRMVEPRAGRPAPRDGKQTAESAP